MRFRELVPSAPPRLDPDDPSHQPMITQWHQAHHEVLSALTNEAYYVDAVAATPLAAKLIEHTWQQVAVLRGLVTDGTFQT